MKLFFQRIWRARLYPGFRDKAAHLAADFLAQASALVGVLGILYFAITWRQHPTMKAVRWSLFVEIVLFTAAVIMQPAQELGPNENNGQSMASTPRRK